MCYTYNSAELPRYPGFALFDKSPVSLYNTVNIAYTDKGKPIERWGRKATGLR